MLVSSRRPGVLSDAGAVFVLDLLAVDLDEVDRLWFFSDWLSASVPRTFEERFHDLCISRGVGRAAAACLDVVQARKPGAAAPS